MSHRPTALARRHRPGSLQASSNSSPVSERPRTTVSVGTLHSGLRCRHAPASAFRQPSPTCRTAFPAQHLRPFSVAGPAAWNSLPDFFRYTTSSTDCFWRLLKRTCSRVTSASSALGVLNNYALYKSTHSLTHPQLPLNSWREPGPTLYILAKMTPICSRLTLAVF